MCGCRTPTRGPGRAGFCRGWRARARAALPGLALALGLPSHHNRLSILYFFIIKCANSKVCPSGLCASVEPWAPGPGGRSAAAREAGRCPGTWGPQEPAVTVGCRVPASGAGLRVSVGACRPQSPSPGVGAAPALWVSHVDGGLVPGRLCIQQGPSTPVPPAPVHTGRPGLRAAQPCLSLAPTPLGVHSDSLTPALPAGGRDPIPHQPRPGLLSPPRHLPRTEPQGTEAAGLRRAGDRLRGRGPQPTRRDGSFSGTITERDALSPLIQPRWAPTGAAS